MSSEERPNWKYFYGKNVKKKAYESMYAFIERYYEQIKSDEFAILLGGISITPQGVIDDPGMWNEWIKAVDKVNKDNVDIRRKSIDGTVF